MDIFSIESLQISLGIISALVLFLYAIDNLSKEMQELATEKFRSHVAKLTRNKYIGTLVGAIASAITQSSSAVTVITVVLVNIGIISFSNSLGVIFGSNIGTTLTSQLALIDSTLLASVLIIVGFFLGISGKKAKLLSKPVFFLGFILFSLSLLSSALEPIKNDPYVIELFSQLSNPILAYTISAMFTSVIQSSSITSGIIVILAQAGLIPIEVSIPMILGANLGSSITTLTASLKLNLFAKRVGFGNFLFNLIGSTLFMVFLPLFISVIQSFSSGIGIQTALAHFLFNVVNTILFLIFLKPFKKLIIKLIKGNEEEILFKTRYLGKHEKRLKAKQRIDNIKKELSYSIENTIKLYQLSLSTFYNSNGSNEMNIHKLETLNDYLDDEITRNILDLSKIKLGHETAHYTVTLIKISNTIEQLGDLALDFFQVFKRMHDLNIPYREIDIERLTDIYNRLMSLFRDVEKNIVSTSTKKLTKIKKKGRRDIHND